MTFLPEVRAVERTRCLYASLAFMCVAAGGLVARTVGDTLFLTRFGSERLPLMYIGTAALVGLIAFVYSSGFGRWPVSTIIGVVAAMLVVAAIGVRISLMGGTSASRVLAYLFAEAVIRVPLLLFWTVAALIFNPRVILVEKVLFLKHVSLFSRMSVGDLGRVAEIAEEVVYAASSNIFREGDYGETASSDCLLLKISQEEFHDILSTHFDTALAVIKTLSRNLRSHVVQYTHQFESEGGSNA